MVSTRSGRKVTVNIPAAVSKKSVVDKVRKAAKQVITKEVRKVNNNSNNNSNNASNVSNNNNNNKSNKKPKRVYVCGDKCKAQKRRIATRTGYPFNVWRQTEKQIKPWSLKAAKEAFDKAYKLPNRRIARMPAKNRRKRVRKTKPKA